MNTGNLKEHLNLLKIKDIKGLIRQYNLHYKIKLSQKKPELISDLLKHFEENIIDNNITSKNIRLIESTCNGLFCWKI